MILLVTTYDVVWAVDANKVFKHSYISGIKQCYEEWLCSIGESIFERVSL